MRADLAPPMHSPAPAVVWNLQAVGVQYGRVSALSGVTLRIAQGERVALVGSNGSGKSTLLRVLHGLVPASSGQVQQDGALRQAMLFQRPHMLRTSVQNNIVLGLWLRGTAWRDAKVQARTALQRVGLQAVAQQNARTLSGGQQQRLALARAWALRPDVLKHFPGSANTPVGWSFRIDHEKAPAGAMLRAQFPSSSGLTGYCYAKVPTPATFTYSGWSRRALR